MSITVHRYFELHINQRMSDMGFGVLFAKNNGEVENAIITAIKTGYRKIYKPRPINLNRNMALGEDLYHVV